MRNLFWSFVVLSLAVIGYCVWALLGAVELVMAAQGGDTDAVMSRVNLPALRHSLAHQIVRSYLKQDDRFRKMSGIGRSVAGGLGTSVADSMLEDVLTPANITKLLKDGRFGSEKLHLGSKVQLPQLPQLSANLQTVGLATVLNTYFDGLTSYAVPIAHNGEQYAVHLLLDGTTWKLGGIDLPPSLVDRLAHEVAERQKQSRNTAPLGARAASAA